MRIQFFDCNPQTYVDGVSIGVPARYACVYSHIRTKTVAQPCRHALGTFLPAQLFKVINLHPPIFHSPSTSPYFPSTLSLPLRFLSLVHRRVAITSLWPKCVTVLSLWLSPSLPPLALSLHPFVSVWTSIKFFPTSCPYYLHPLLKAQHFLTSFANADLSIIGLPLLCLSASPLKVTGRVNSQYSTSDLTVSLYLSLKVLMQLLNPSRCIAWIVSSFFVSSYPDLTCLPSSPSGLYIKHSRVSGWQHLHSVLIQMLISTNITKKERKRKESWQEIKPGA